MGFDEFHDQLPDINPTETKEWVDALVDVSRDSGSARASFLLRKLLGEAHRMQIGVPAMVSTRYVNSIAPEDEPPFPGDEEMERRIRGLIRWNAAIMVLRANEAEPGIGGHLATYASAASLIEVGFNHFFRGKQHPGGGDQIFFQGHASPGIYARAFLEGRLTESHLDRFRREVGGGGLSSYPHPRLMPDFWEFPTVSMGLGAINAVYQARFNRYLAARGFKDTSDQRVWMFAGDGEMDEPESIAALTLASRERLDNLTMVINCNLQRLDGPVRGNGKVIQELESLFRGAGWHVIKVVWGSEWDDLLAKDVDGVLVKRMDETCDGDFQKFATEGGAYAREHFFGTDPRLLKLVEHLSDSDIDRLRRGGHDYRKLHAAYKVATELKDQPTVILAHTIKGWLLGEDIQARNVTHQAKKMTDTDLQKFRDKLGLPITDAQIEDLPYFHPGPESDVVKYMLSRRGVLGGFVPSRVVKYPDVVLPETPPTPSVEKKESSTTQGFVRLLRSLLKDPNIGTRIVPIVPDESRTFGMESLFKSHKIYNPNGQRYEAVDKASLLPYVESETGQMIEEGITEAGSMAMFTAAGTAYATHGQPMIPFFVFYSMFGFQRVGDLIWSFADQRGRGFLCGATYGRTTLNGEGLQHADGHSLFVATTVPNCRAYDPAFPYEVEAIVRHGLREMWDEGQDVFYYLTLYNEPAPPTEMPAGVEGDIIRGLYVLRQSPITGVPMNILASGPIVQQALEAQRVLAEEFGTASRVFSATSYERLRADALSGGEFLSSKLDGGSATLAVSDSIRAVPDQIARFVRHPYSSLGTDGFGLSDSRKALRAHFGVDAASIVAAARALQHHESLA